MARLYGPGPGEPEPLQAGEDLAGMAVDDAGGRSTGDVFGTLSEIDSGLVRYFDVSLHHEPRHVLIPVGHVRLEEHVDGLRARLRAAMREDLATIPPFEPHAHEIDDDYERSLLSAHGRLFYGERYYAHPSFDHDGLYAGEHPVVHEADEEDEAGATGLAPLSDLTDFRIAEGEPDIRGWPLLSRDDLAVGTIADLIIEPAARKVRYAVVRLDHREFHVLLPIGYLDVDVREQRATVSALDADDLRALPPHQDGAIHREQEERLRDTIEERIERHSRRARPDFTPPRGLARR